MNRRTFIRGATLTAVAGLVAAPCWIGTHELETTKTRLDLGLPRSLRLAALGDLHFDPLYEEAYYEGVVRELTASKADLIAFTGDFITRHFERMGDLAQILGKAESRLGSFAVLGNHDMWWGTQQVASALERNGIRVLRNECLPLPGMDNVFLSGLESYWGGEPKPSVLARTPGDSRHILLLHEPDPFAQLNDARIRFQISGHTHGGQVRVPFTGALRLPKWGMKFQEGLYARDGRYLYVNRGVGTIRPHVRFNCRPEISVFELT